MSDKGVSVSISQPMMVLSLSGCAMSLIALVVVLVNRECIRNLYGSFEFYALIFSATVFGAISLLTFLASLDGRGYSPEFNVLFAACIATCSVLVICSSINLYCFKRKATLGTGSAGEVQVQPVKDSDAHKQPEECKSTADEGAGVDSQSVQGGKAVEPTSGSSEANANPKGSNEPASTPSAPLKPANGSDQEHGLPEKSAEPAGGSSEANVDPKGPNEPASTPSAPLKPENGGDQEHSLPKKDFNHHKTGMNSESKRWHAFYRDTGRRNDGGPDEDDDIYYVQGFARLSEKKPVGANKRPTYYYLRYLDLCFARQEVGIVTETDGESGGVEKGDGSDPKGSSGNDGDKKHGPHENEGSRKGSEDVREGEPAEGGEVPVEGQEQGSEAKGGESKGTTELPAKEPAGDSGKPAEENGERGEDNRGGVGAPSGDKPTEGAGESASKGDGDRDVQGGESSGSSSDKKPANEKDAASSVQGEGDKAQEEGKGAGAKPDNEPLKKDGATSSEQEKKEDSQGNGDKEPKAPPQEEPKK